MRKIIKYFLFIVVLAFHAVLFAGINYVFPHYEVTKVINTDVKRMDKEGLISKSNPADALTTRDVYFINTKLPDEQQPMVYRNEDTRWGFPFYFKFDSANLQAKAQDFAEKQSWVEVKYYGWRFNMFDEFRNVVSIHEVASPDEVSHPILSYIFYFFGLLTLFFSIQFIRGWFDSE
ncbi:MAG: DUF1523 family protein [Pasteurellaceae bacterium]|nr:DUF1523 family protein [Pasteurellaceae bacterium]